MPTVILYWSPGRTPEQKADVIHHVTEVLVEYGGARREDVLVIFQDIAPGDAGRGGKVIESPTEDEASVDTNLDFSTKPAFQERSKNSR